MKYIKKILYIDKYISGHNAESEWKNQVSITLIASISFLIMSFLNIFQHSTLMLVTTGGSSAILLLCYLVSRKRRNIKLLKAVFLMIFLIVFTFYTVIGGNQGFAALWLILAPFVAMLVIDLRYGFLISLYFQIMLLLLFETPLRALLKFAYDPTFLLRFPFLYLISFAFAVFIEIRTRRYQYQLILNQQEVERLSSIDTMTGLLNRNSYNKYRAAANPEAVSRLTAIYIDVNGLHGINNQLGHDAGDQMLRVIASSCRDAFPEGDVYRLGGDEFLVLGEFAPGNGADEAIKKLLALVERSGYSISYGADGPGSAELDELVKSADQRMLRNKNAYYEKWRRARR